MQLGDLEVLSKPVSECTEEELEKRLNLLKKLRLTADTKRRVRPKSNKHKKIEDLLKNLSPEELEKLQKLL